jgi:hypothetical protein
MLVSRSMKIAGCGIALATLAAFAAPDRANQLSQAPAGQTVGGISCDAQEGQRIHIHQHLAIFDHGTLVAIPNNVGRPAMRPCLYWLHTHTPDGIIHIEAPSDRSYTLSDFFLVWGQPLGKTIASTAHAGKGDSMKVWVDGNPYAGNPRAIPLKPHTDIVIEVGPPFVPPPRYTTWGTL